MATTTLYWNDGTLDRIVIETSEAGGEVKMDLSADPNFTKAERRITLTICDDNDADLDSLVITQSRGGAFSVGFSKGFYIE